MQFLLSVSYARLKKRIVILYVLQEIPIDAKTAFKAAEIAKRRKFTMEHGGVITTRDIFGVQRSELTFVSIRLKCSFKFNLNSTVHLNDWRVYVRKDIQCL